MQDIEPLDVQQLLQNPPPGLQLLDVRLPWEYETVHLMGATLIPLHELPKRQKELNKDRAVLVYCHHGVRSLQAAAFLEHAGFSDVRNLSGGIDAYAHEADRKLKRY